MFISDGFFFLIQYDYKTNNVCERKNEMKFRQNYVGVFVTTMIILKIVTRQIKISISNLYGMK